MEPADTGTKVERLKGPVGTWLASLGLERGKPYLAADLIESFREEVGPMDHVSLGMILRGYGMKPARVRLADGSRRRCWVRS